MKKMEKGLKRGEGRGTVQGNQGSRSQKKCGKILKKVRVNFPCLEKIKTLVGSALISRNSYLGRTKGDCKKKEIPL